MAQELKILVVDDDPVALEVAAAVLESLGHQVIRRDRALGTTVAALRERPEVVVLDVEMPGISGGELMKAISEQSEAFAGWKPAFVFYSGMEAEELDQLAAEAGALGGVTKAGDVASLRAAFEAVLQSAANA